MDLASVRPFLRLHYAACFSCSDQTFLYRRPPTGGYIAIAEVCYCEFYALLLRGTSRRCLGQMIISAASKSIGQCAATSSYDLGKILDVILI